jgi:Arc/MetJ-type ribon-helix-helix transcriptional regulator
MVEMPKKRVYATIREDLVKWVDSEVRSLRFANRSHAIEYALSRLKEESEKKEA